MSSTSFLAFAMLVVLITLSWSQPGKAAPTSANADPERAAGKKKCVTKRKDGCSIVPEGFQCCNYSQCIQPGRCELILPPAPASWYTTDGKKKCIQKGKGKGADGCSVDPEGFQCCGNSQCFQHLGQPWGRCTRDDQHFAELESEYGPSMPPKGGE